MTRRATFLHKNEMKPPARSSSTHKDDLQNLAGHIGIANTSVVRDTLLRTTVTSTFDARHLHFYCLEVKPECFMQFEDHINSVCTAKICSNNTMPTASKIRANLGPSLAQAFFEYSHYDTKTLLDLKEPLKSPKTCFPELEEKTQDDKALPLHNELIKADVHQNILEIGESILQRVQKQIEESLRERIEKQTQEKFHMYQAKKRLEAERYAEELHAKYDNYIKTVQKELEKQLKVEWAKAAAEYAKNTQKAVVQERMNVTHDMMRKMRLEMTYVIGSLYKEFEEMFIAQRDNIIADFNSIMREKHVKMVKEMQEFERKVSMDLYIQKHQLEMQSTVDIIYLLCMERLRSCTEKHAMHMHFQKQIHGFHELIDRLNNVLTVMRAEIVHCHVEQKLLEEQLSDVIEQFQKFIDFVFYAVPGQAQFLLPFKLQRLSRSNTSKKENSQAKNLNT
ncbi:uncharacterized protein LOC143177268 [Calliopsis andreniformis]|uniref:uncharacterized protein LOC143177268 n=1 Tax=Calliopsis andreniformis TaxID=337506 RepID=UPI003FCD1547